MYVTQHSLTANGTQHLLQEMCLWQQSISTMHMGIITYDAKPDPALSNRMSGVNIPEQHTLGTPATLVPWTTG